MRKFEKATEARKYLQELGFIADGFYADQFLDSDLLISDAAISNRHDSKFIISLWERRKIESGTIILDRIKLERVLERCKKCPEALKFISFNLDLFV